MGLIVSLPDLIAYPTSTSVCCAAVSCGCCACCTCPVDVPFEPLARMPTRPITSTVWSSAATAASVSPVVTRSTTFSQIDPAASFSPLSVLLSTPRNCAAATSASIATSAPAHAAPAAWSAATAAVSMAMPCAIRAPPPHAELARPICSRATPELYIAMADEIADENVWSTAGALPSAVPTAATVRARLFVCSMYAEAAAPAQLRDAVCAVELSLVPPSDSADASCCRLAASALIGAGLAFGGNGTDPPDAITSSPSGERVRAGRHGRAVRTVSGCGVPRASARVRAAGRPPGRAR